jgi:hypothetical protein
MKTALLLLTVLFITGNEFSQNIDQKLLTGKR